MNQANMYPDVILLFSGKRKSGKDFITDRLQEMLGDDVATIVKISHPIKSHWAKEMKLDLKLLLGDGEYKEQYRLEMIKWSEEMRRKDFGCFCRIACKNAKLTRVWVVSDIRRKTDLQWFRETYGAKVKSVKVLADLNVRVDRGWVLTPGVDDAMSECDLDDVQEWDYFINNNSMDVPAEALLCDILKAVKAS